MSSLENNMNLRNVDYGFREKKDKHSELQEDKCQEDNEG